MFRRVFLVDTRFFVILAACVLMSKTHATDIF